LAVATLIALGYDLRGAIGWLATASLAGAAIWGVAALLRPRDTALASHP
jgi:hypothetical protein